MRVSTHEQDIDRQRSIIDQAKSQGYYVAGIYEEKASGAREDRPELLRLIDDLQPNDVVVAESIDRITRLPYEKALKLVESIEKKGAKLSVPGILDLTDLIKETDGGVAKIVIDSVQKMLLKISLQIASDDYELRRERQRQGIQKAKIDGKYKGRVSNEKNNQLIIELRKSGKSIHETSKLVPCSVSQVKKVWSKYKALNEGKTT